MSVIVDTSVWIDGFNPKIQTPEKEMLIQLIQNDHPIYLCPVIYQEILQGIREEKTFQQIKSTLQQYRMIPVDIMHVTDCAIDLYRRLRKKGITIRKSMDCMRRVRKYPETNTLPKQPTLGLVDCLIASYAIITEIPLLHNDADFTQIAKGSALKIWQGL